MQTENRFFDDMARVAGGALGVLSGARAEIEGLVRQQLDRMLGQMDLVTREEFDAARDMAAKAREDQERMAERVAGLEARLATLESAPARKSGGKSRSGKTAGGASAEAEG